MITKKISLCRWISTLAELEHTVEALHASSALPALSDSKRREVVSLVQACGDFKAASETKQVHRYIQRIGLGRDIFVANLLVNTYIRCGKLHEARSLFDEILVRDCVLWTSMISAYAHKGHPEAFLLFRQMQQEGVHPDSVTFATILNACAVFSRLFLAEAELLHARVADLGLISSNPFVGTALINLYGRSGDVEKAGDVFREMHSLATVPWNAMITALTMNGHCREAMQLLWEMLFESVRPNGTTFVSVLNGCSELDEGILIREMVSETGFESDVVVATALLNMFGKFSHQERHAAEIFARMPVRNVVTWNAMISVYSHNEKFEEAFHVFTLMQLEGVRPTEATFLAATSACEVFFHRGSVIHAAAAESGFVPASILVSTALVEMYSRLGKVAEGIRVFEKVGCKDVILWNSMITAFAQAGRTSEAVQMFHRMQTEGATPDHLTFLTVLNASCAGGESKYGKRIHERVVQSGVQIDAVLGTALVNMYGKCGELETARSIFNRMRNQRGLVTWNAMISCCVHVQQQQESREALLLFRQMLLEGVKPDRITFLSTLSACSALADLLTGSKIHSWIEETNMTFLNHDRLLLHALLNMYCKCGGIEQAKKVMELIREAVNEESDTSCWNSIISASASQGSGLETLKLLFRMQQEGWRPGRLTFVSVLASCSRAGLVEQGLECWRVMVQECGVEASHEHQGCVIDLLARAGKLREAEELMTRFGQSGNSVVCMSVAGASKLHGDGGRARWAAEGALKADAAHNGAYVALAQLA